MKEKVIIASDSTCDLSPELIEKYGIRILPLHVNLGDATYRDGVDIDPDRIYEHYARYGELPKTAAVNSTECLEFLRPLTEDGCSVVFFTVSSLLSSTYSSACLAVRELENAYAVDTKNLSTGSGLLVLRAAELAQEGRPAKEIAQICRELADHVDASFVVDDLEFLKKGGRCSAMEAIGANLLRIKPCIAVRNGRMFAAQKYRGHYPDALRKYIQAKLADPSDIDLSRIFVTHAGCDDELCRQCVEQVKELADFQEVLLTRAGCTVSSHCGRNTLGILFIRKTALQ